MVRVSGGRGAKPGTILRTPPTKDGYPHANLKVDGVDTGLSAQMDALQVGLSAVFH